MNLLDATEVNIPSGFSPGNGHEAKDCLFGIRPELLHFDADGRDFSVTARITSSEYEGSVFLVHLVTPSGKRLSLSHRGESVPAEGSDVTLGWDRKATHLFSKHDGNALDIAT
jgi:ABC-type Fe3+/spermidine/putrescine transport system ATPase subunit